jgi:predicted DNA-binding transcriptional regulator AlpA
MELPPRLLRTQAAATYCGFTKSTFEKMRCYGTGPRFVRRGASVFYDLRDLDEWLGSLPRFTSTSDPGQDNSRHGA